jgi:hypothetical protein
VANVRNIFTADKFEAGIRKLDISDKIFELQPDATPFITILSKMNKRKTTNYEYTWFEDDLLANYTKADGAYAAGDTDITVDETLYFTKYDVLKVLATSEVILVTDIDDATKTLTVKRGWGTTAAGVIANDGYLYKLGNAQQEAYTAGGGLVTAKTPQTNYIQIFSKSIEISETADKIATYGGNRRAFERRKKMIEFMREIEAQFIWGEKKLDVTGAHPSYQTGGLLSWLGSTCPTLDMNSAALTETSFEGFLRDLFTYDSEDRYFFTSSLIISQISQFAAAKQRVEAGKTIKYGVAVSTYHSPHGDIHLVKDRHFSGPNAGMGIALKIDEMTYVYLDGSDVSVATDIQNKKDHYKLDELSATLGFEIHHGSSLHGIVKNVA